MLSLKAFNIFLSSESMNGKKFKLGFEIGMVEKKVDLSRSVIV